MKGKGRRVLIAVAVLAVVTLMWAGITMRERIQEWFLPDIRMEICLAESSAKANLQEKEFEGKKYYLHPAVVTNRDLVRARSMMAESGSLAISLQFTNAGGEKLARLTGENMRKLMAVLVDGQIVMVASIRSRVYKKVQITGLFTRDEVDRIVESINGR